MAMIPPHVFGICAFSGTGKTTLLQQVIPLLRNAGLRVGLVKHAHHHFEVDQPGKDSYELRKAGAEAVLVASQQRWALMRETPELQQAPDLALLLQAFPTDELDLILVEGFKAVDFPKLELHRPSLGHPLLQEQVPGVIAIATDAPLEKAVPVPVLNLNDPEQIARFLQEQSQKEGAKKGGAPSRGR